MAIHRLVFTTPTLAKYRVKFHELVRQKLHGIGFEYKLIYGQPGRGDAERHDSAELSWATKIKNRYGLSIAKTATWQPIFREIRAGDFVILGQQNRLLANYVLQSSRRLWPIRIALWGHGRNFQSANPSGIVERWKRLWALQSDWWFAYTDQTAALIAGYGFPREKITVFENATDTTELRRLFRSIDDHELANIRRRLELKTPNIGLHIGGIYREKRLDFLIEACAAVRRQIPDFALVVAGGGTDRHVVESAAVRYPWVRYLGPTFGRDKAELLKLGRVFLMPRLVGLSVVDCLAIGLPMITTSHPHHGPEIVYLKDGVNGIIVREWQDPQSYADAVVRCLQDDVLLARLSAGAIESGRRYTVENMADRFVAGAVKAMEG